MLNQLVLVGRLTKDVETKNEGGYETAIITLAISRSFKNADGEYETDFVDCVLYNTIATNTAEYCRKGDIVGVKGRVQTTSIDKEDGQKEFRLQVIAEKVTFLSSKPKEEE